jgi:hypothetical protein
MSYESEGVMKCEFDDWPMTATQPTHIITIIVHRGDIKDDAQFFLLKQGYSLESIISDIVRLNADATKLEIIATKLRKDSDNDSQ